MADSKFSTFLTASLLAAAFFSGCIEQVSPGPSAPANVDVFFCPADRCEDRAVNAIANSKESVDVAIYSFTSKEIEQALLKAKAKGVKVRVILDYVQSSQESSVAKGLQAKGVDVRIYPKSTVMHNKYAVIDNKVVITGSFNWTTNADERNRENLLVSNSPALAEKYESDFFKLWIEAG